MSFNLPKDTHPPPTNTQAGKGRGNDRMKQMMKDSDGETKRLYDKGVRSKLSIPFRVWCVYIQYIDGGHHVSCAWTPLHYLFTEMLRVRALLRLDRLQVAHSRGASSRYDCLLPQTLRLWILHSDLLRMFNIHKSSNEFFTRKHMYAETDTETDTDTETYIQIHIHTNCTHIIQIELGH